MVQRAVPPARGRHPRKWLRAKLDVGPGARHGIGSLSNSLARAG